MQGQKLDIKKPQVGVIGVGAFGEFMLKYLIPYYFVVAYDRDRDLQPVIEKYHMRALSLEEVAASDTVIISVPVSQLESVVEQITPYLKPGALVIDLCSVKVRPTEVLLRHLPESVEYISLHPLFGPQSGKAGIHGLNIAMCPVRSTRTECVREFLGTTLGLKVHDTTPELHDQEMAYVQGLTHMIAKIFTFMDVPKIHQKTRTYMLLDEMVEMIRYDSDDLFNAIQRDNPFVSGTKEKFFTAVKALEERINKAG